MSRAVFAAAILLAAPAFAQGRYFAAIEDLPMAPGLEETSAGFVFEGAAGRIVEVAAQGATSPEEVRDFYRAALPALGWAENPGAQAPEYLRGRERLTLIVAATESGAQLEARLIVRAPPAPD